MFYYPNRDQAIRIQKTLESLYKSVDLLGILRDLAAERTAQHGK